LRSLSLIDFVSSNGKYTSQDIIKFFYGILGNKTYLQNEVEHTALSQTETYIIEK